MVRVETTSRCQWVIEHHNYIDQADSCERRAIELISNDTYTAMGWMRQWL
jgi:hypothetical protein